MKAIIGSQVLTETSRPSLIVFLLLFVLRVGSLDIRAQGTIYTDRSAYIATLQSGTTITFESLAPSSPFSTGVSPVTVSGASFTNAESRLFVTSPSTGIYPTPGDGQYLWNFDSSYPVGIFLPGGRNAFGADFSGGIVQNNPFNATLTFTLLDGQTYVHNFTGQLGSWTFRGFVFPQAIRSLVYDDGGPFLPGAHEEMLDNVTFGVVVPEPKSLLIALNAVIVWFCSRRTRGPRPVSKAEITSPYGQDQAKGKRSR